MDIDRLLIDTDKQMTQARDQLTQEREKVAQRLNEIDQKLARINAYFGAAQPQKTRTPRRTGKREEIYNIIASHPNGIDRSELLTQLGAKGDKKAEQSISNAISALSRDERINTERGHYTLRTATHSGKPTNHGGETRVPQE